MPVQIGEINSEVVVDSTRGSGGESAESPSAPPSPQDEQRWQALERRTRQLAARTAAWGFDD